jgi:hypothetical protein
MVKPRTAKAVSAEWRRDARALAKAPPFSPEATILIAGLQRLKQEFERLLDAENAPDETRRDRDN